MCFPLPERADCVLESRPRALVIVLRAGVLDFRLSHVELRLGEFDDRRESQVVSSLREIQGQPGLVEQPLGDGNSLVCVLRGEQSGSNIMLDLLLQIPQPLVGRDALVVSLARPRGEQVAVEDRNLQIESSAFVTVRGGSRILVYIRKRAAERDKAESRPF